jgi:hypothetical protein
MTLHGLQKQLRQKPLDATPMQREGMQNNGSAVEPQQREIDGAGGA